VQQASRQRGQGIWTGGTNRIAQLFLHLLGLIRPLLSLHPSTDPGSALHAVPINLCPGICQPPWDLLQTLPVDLRPGICQPLLDLLHALRATPYETLGEVFEGGWGYENENGLQSRACARERSLCSCFAVHGMVELRRRARARCIAPGLQAWPCSALSCSCLGRSCWGDCS